MVKATNAADFQSALSQSASTVLKIGAPWCSACKSVEPIVEQVALENLDVSFFDMNADQNVDYVMSLGVRSLPTFVFFKGGEIISADKGLTEALLRKKVEQLRG